MEAAVEVSLEAAIEISIEAAVEVAIYEEIWEIAIYKRNLFTSRRRIDILV
ncbi:MAG: hypothetical protein LBL49_04200 [Clostridiales Family XIII bacterium]|jgi:hypothetical protein|nr:hypothetical protein [Clostridiales Family XIII bacterium]